LSGPAVAEDDRVDFLIGLVVEELFAAILAAKKGDVGDDDVR